MTVHDIGPEEPLQNECTSKGQQETDSEPRQNIPQPAKKVTKVTVHKIARQEADDTELEVTKGNFNTSILYSGCTTHKQRPKAKDLF